MAKLLIYDKTADLLTFLTFLAKSVSSDATNRRFLNYGFCQNVRNVTFSAPCPSTLFGQSFPIRDLGQPDLSTLKIPGFTGARVVITGIS